MNLQILKVNKSHQVALIVIACYVVIAIVFYLVSISPKLSTLRQASNGIKEKEEMISRSGGYERLLERIKEGEREVVNLKSKIDYYEKMLPTEKDIPYLLQYLSQIGKETQVKLMKIEKLKEIKSERDQALYVTVPLSLTFKSGYHNSGLFINKLETAKRFMKIQDFTISGNTKLPLEHKIDVLIYTYMLWQEEKEE